jgi:hypothetical protein
MGSQATSARRHTHAQQGTPPGPNVYELATREGATRKLLLEQPPIHSGGFSFTKLAEEVHIRKLSSDIRVSDLRMEATS